MGNINNSMTDCVMGGLSIRERNFLLISVFATCSNTQCYYVKDFIGIFNPGYKYQYCGPKLFLFYILIRGINANVVNLSDFSI